MEVVGFHYNVSCRILFQLQDVKRLQQYAVTNADVALGQSVNDLMISWLGIFASRKQTHNVDEIEFSLTAEDIAHFVRVCPQTPTLEQLAFGEASSTEETDFREKLMDAAMDLVHEEGDKNIHEPLVSSQPWYCRPLNAICKTMWWSCHAIVAKDGLVTFYVDGFAQLKLKFRPRVGSQVNMFEVVDSWSGKVETVWADWRPGKIYGLDDLLAALNETRRIANGQWENWDDVNKVFIPNSDGNGLSARCE